MHNDISVNKILNTHVTLAPEIKEKLRLLSELNQLWPNEVEDSLAQHSRIANWRDQCLVIEVDSSAWATRLRYSIPDLLKKLRHHRALKQLKTIEWYINPTAQASSSEPTRPPLNISTTAAKLITEIADFTQHERLKQALLKLGKHVEAKT